LLNITFLSLHCQCVYIGKSDFVNFWTSEICVRLIRFLNRTFSNSVKLSKRLPGLNSDWGCTCVHSALQRSECSSRRSAVTAAMSGSIGSARLVTAKTRYWCWSGFFMLYHWYRKNIHDMNKFHNLSRLTVTYFNLLKFSRC